MKATFGGITVEGTPQEIMEFRELLSQKSKEDLNKNYSTCTTYIELNDDDVYAEIDAQVQKIKEKNKRKIK
jgi:hypothetical protein